MVQGKVMVSLQLSPATVERIDALAADRGWSRARMLRELVGESTEEVVRHRVTSRKVAKTKPQFIDPDPAVYRKAALDMITTASALPKPDHAYKPNGGIQGSKCMTCGKVHP